MKRIVLVISIICTFVSCKVKHNYGYEIIPVNVGSQGSSLLKVYSYADDLDEATELSKRNAVDGVLFKGIVSGNGAYGQPALVTSSELDAHKDFFDNFFKSGKYLQFVNISGDGTIDTKDMFRVGDKYKIGVVVSVNKSALRKYLEDQKIIKRLGNIFN